MHRRSFCAAAAWALLSALPAPVRAALSDADLALAEALIERVAGTADLVFIRNGSEHGAAEAAEHLRTKLAATRGRLDSVDQFVDRVASVSSVSGEPYRLRLADGRVVDAQGWLHAELRKLRGMARRQ